MVPGLLLLLLLMQDQVNSLLREAFGPRVYRPGTETALNALLGTILTQNTSDIICSRAFSHLRSEFGGLFGTAPGPLSIAAGESPLCYISCMTTFQCIQVSIYHHDHLFRGVARRAGGRDRRRRPAPHQGCPNQGPAAAAHSASRILRARVFEGLDVGANIRCVHSTAGAHTCCLQTH